MSEGGYCICGCGNSMDGDILSSFSLYICEVWRVRLGKGVGGVNDSIFICKCIEGW